LDLVMEGALDDIIQALVTHEQAEKLKNEAVAA
jgi:protein subunit release factor A